MFSSLGKLIERSGGPYTLGESGLISIGSINKFLKGKMYNRCRRGHLLLSAALQGLYFKKFIDDVNDGRSVIAELTEWSEKDDKKPSESLLNFVKKYHNYTEKTLTGGQGKTAQFWMSYCKLTELYLIMHRAVKSNDTDFYA